MFSGIISDVGMVRTVEQRGDLRLQISCGPAMSKLDLGASIACSGACLTVVDRGERWFAVDVSKETISRTVPGQWHAGSRLNLERACKLGDELGGHIVTGHVEAVASVIRTQEVGGSIQLEIEAPHKAGRGIMLKGPIAVDGVSLTVNAVAEWDDGVRFAVNVISHTGARTTLGKILQGNQVNIETDVVARYMQRLGPTNGRRFLKK
jgi:riboflavin synthase